MINEKDKEGNLLPDELRHRHDVCPGLTGYAQAHGRNAVTWEDKFKMDVWYTRNVFFMVFASCNACSRRGTASSGLQ